MDLKTIRQYLAKLKLSSADRHTWDTVFTIDKFTDVDGRIALASHNGLDLEALKEAFPGAFKETVTIEKNVALKTGLACLIDIFAGLDGTRVKFDSSHAHIGIGETNISANAEQTCLQAEIAVPVMNYAYLPMDSGYPKRINQTLIFRSTYDNDTANFSWNEVVVSNGPNGLAPNICINRRVEVRGVKPNYETWIMNSKQTFS